MRVSLTFKKMGSGPNMVILHGLYGSSDNWLTIGKHLSETYTVYLLNLRNHGDSPNADVHTFDAMSEDVAGFFEEQNLDKAIILGHSMGGKVAMHFAADYPEKVNCLIVADIAPKDYTEVDRSKSNFSLHQTILELLDELDLSQVKTRTEIDHYLATKLNAVGLRQFLLKNIKRTKEGKFMWRLNVPVLKEYLPRIISEVNAEWFEDRKPILRYPVTFIRGLKSKYIMDEDIPAIKDIYPDARIIDIPDAGHWLHAEQPELFLQAVLSCVKAG